MCAGTLRGAGPNSSLSRLLTNFRESPYMSNRCRDTGDRVVSAAAAAGVVRRGRVLLGAGLRLRLLLVLLLTLFVATLTELSCFFCGYNRRTERRSIETHS